jgi:hypothetical protein
MFSDRQAMFAENNLLINADKSEVVFIGTSAQLHAVSTVNQIPVAGSSLTLSSQLKTLSVIVDPKPTFDAHVSAVCKACNYHIWAMSHIRRLPLVEVVQTLACSIVTSCLDYCNSILYGAPDSTVYKLQRIQNSLVRVVLH